MGCSPQAEAQFDPLSISIFTAIQLAVSVLKMFATMHRDYLVASLTNQGYQEFAVKCITSKAVIAEATWPKYLAFVTKNAAILGCPPDKQATMQGLLEDLSWGGACGRPQDRNVGGGVAETDRLTCVFVVLGCGGSMLQ